MSCTSNGEQVPFANGVSQDLLCWLRLWASRRPHGEARCALYGLLIMLLVAVLTAPGASAAPPGRAWSPVQRLVANSHRFMFPCRFEPTTTGALRLVGNGVGGPGDWLTGFEWADTSWSVRWVHRDESFVVVPMYVSRDREVLVWKTQNDSTSAFARDNLLLSTPSGDSLAVPDTIGGVFTRSNHYSASVSDSCVFVVVDDDAASPVLRTFVRRADSPRWSTAQHDTLSHDGISVTAVGDTECVVVYNRAGVAGPLWAVLTPNTWTPSPAPLDHWYGLLLSGSMAPDGSGGFWLFYGTVDDLVQVVHWRPGVGWADRDSVRGLYPPTLYHAINYVDASRDGRPRPVIAWSSFGSDGAERVHVAWPNAHGWDVGTEPEGEVGGATPSVACDENDDAWVAWFGDYDGIFWSHSYVSAVTDTPLVRQSGAAPKVSWNLNVQAPASAWTLWRAEGGGPFTQVARVIADSTLAMSVVDSTAPAGRSLRYRVQRECRDTRYLWRSAEASWTGRASHVSLAVRSHAPSDDDARILLLGADAGPVTLELYDAQGRLVTRTQVRAAGSGQDEVVFDLRAVRAPGLYLLRARTKTRGDSQALKLVVVR